jgi:hypothetical protein
VRPASSIADVDRGATAGVRWASGATECWGWVDWTLNKFGVGQGFGGLPDFEVVVSIAECTMCADGRGALHGIGR